MANNLSDVKRKRGKLTEVANGSMWGTVGMLLVVPSSPDSGLRTPKTSVSVIHSQGDISLIRTADS